MVTTITLLLFNNSLNSSSVLGADFNNTTVGLILFSSTTPMSFSTPKVHNLLTVCSLNKFDGTTITALFILSFAMVMIIVSVLPVPVGITTVAASEETDQ